MPKKRTPKPPADDATYTERADLATVKVTKHLLRDAGKHFGRSQTLAKQSADLMVESVNEARLAGQKIVEARGRAQIDFAWFDSVKQLLPPDLDRHKAQTLARIATAMTEPAKNLDTCRKSHLVQAVLELAGAVATPHRLEQQQASHTSNPFSAFVSACAGLVRLIEDLESERPLEQWPADALREFATALSPLAAKRDESLKLLPVNE